MKFVAVEDINAPLEAVWDRVSDIDKMEARIAPRTETLTRTPSGPAAVGTTWSGRAKVNGKVRDVSATLAKMTPQSALLVEGGTDGMALTVDAELEALSPSVTRLTVTTEARAKSLAARLMLQSAKLARSTMAKRYKGRLAKLAEEIEKSARG